MRRLILISSISFIFAQSVVDEGSRTDLMLTIYSGGTVLVTDTRIITIPPEGTDRILIEGIPRTIIPASIQATAREGRFRVHSQTYHKADIATVRLLTAYVGRRVQLVNYNDRNQVTGRVSADLIAMDGKQPLFKIGADVHINHTGHIVLPDVPADLLTKRHLEWVASGVPGARTVDIVYLAGAVTWHADYVFRLSADGSRGALSGWYTVDNASDVEYPHAQIQLVAGDLHRSSPAPLLYKRGRTAAMAVESFDAVKAESFEQYFLFSLPGTHDISTAESVQIPVPARADLEVDRIFQVMIPADYGYQPQQATRSLPVNTLIRFSIPEGGDPLAGGIVRIFSQTADGQFLFAGEDRVGHSPAGAEVKLTMGIAAELLVEAKQLSYKRLDDKRTNRYETKNQITLTNRKTEDVEIQVNARMRGDWKLLSSSHDMTKIDAATAQFTIPVAAGKSSTLHYSIRVTL